MKKRISVKNIVKHPMFIIFASILLLFGIALLVDKTPFAPLAAILSVVLILYIAVIIFKTWVAMIKRWFK